MNHHNLSTPSIRLRFASASVRAARTWSKALAIGFVLAAFLLVPSEALGQSGERELNGRVIDASTELPIPSAVVQFKQSGTTAITDLRGDFRIAWSAGNQDTLQVHLLGYRPVRMAIKADQIGGARLEVKMEPLPIRMESITVSATREERYGSELPVSVGRIDADEIGRVNPAHPSRIANRIPGVWINATEGEGHMTAIRQPLSLLPQFLFLENGIPTRSTGFFNHNALFEVNIPQASSIEVIKGPGTALYGSDAIGGVINVETGRIPIESGASLTAEAGSFGFLRGLVSASNVGARDAFRADINWTNSDGWRRGTEYRRNSATLAWQRQTGKASRLNTVATFTRVEQNPAGIAAISTEDYESDPRTNYTPISYRDVTAFRVSSAWQRWSGRSLFSVTPFLRYSAMELLPNWALTFDPAVWETANWSLGSQVRWRWINPSETVRTVSGLDFDWSPGYRIETEVSADRVASIFVDYERGALQYDYDVTYMQAAPFVHAEWMVTPRLRTTAGLRLDLAGYDYENHLGALDSGRHKRPASERITYSQLSPKAGVTFEATDDLTLFTSYRHAFRVPSERQIFRQGSSRSSIGLKPVRAENLEAGLRWTRGERLGLEVVGYVLTKDDDIVTFNFEDGSRGSVNTGQTRHRGLEMGMNTRPVRDVRLSFAWTVAEHTYEAWVTELDQDFSGNEMELAPRHLVHGELAWSPAMLAGSELAVEWHRVGSYWMNPDNTVKYDGHNLVHIRAVGRINDNWSVLGRVGNVGDTLYAQRALTNAFRGDEWAPGLPRNINVALRGTF